MALQNSGKRIFRSRAVMRGFNAQRLKPCLCDRRTTGFHFLRCEIETDWKNWNNYFRLAASSRARQSPPVRRRINLRLCHRRLKGLVAQSWFGGCQELIRIQSFQSFAASVRSTRVFFFGFQVVPAFREYSRRGGHLPDVNLLFADVHLHVREL
jgi:hypothetical protein